MADLMFSHDAGMQDGTGDGSYMDFLHKYMSVVAVSTYQTPSFASNTLKKLTYTKSR